MNQNKFNRQLLEACCYGQLEVVEYLLTSHELKEHADIHYQNQYGKNALMYACREGHLEIAKYLLTSPELKECADIHHQNDNGWNAFLESCWREHLDIVEYLLFEQNFSVNINSMNWLEENNYHNIIKMINARDFHNKLQNEMNEKSHVQRKKI